jgi:Tfp pilus assembly protein PilO
VRGRRRLLAVVGLVAGGLAVLVLGVLLVVKPQREKVKSLHAQIDQAQIEILSTRAAQNGTSNVGATQIFQLSRAMPFTDDMPGILLTLSRTAAATSTALVSVRPSTRMTLPDGSSAVPVQIVLDGSYAHVERFLEQLRSAVRLVRGKVRTDGRLFTVDQVQLTSSPGSATGTGPQSEVSATLNLVAFDYVAPAAPVSSGLDATSATGEAASGSSSVSAAGPTTGAGG